MGEANGRGEWERRMGEGGNSDSRTLAFLRTCTVRGLSTTHYIAQRYIVPRARHPTPRTVHTFYSHLRGRGSTPLLSSSLFYRLLLKYW